MSEPIEEEGNSYDDVFTSLFQPSNTAERLKKERRASRTPKERSRGGRGLARSTQINFRATPRIKKLVEALAEKLDRSAADVLEEAIEAMAKTHKLGNV